MKNVLSLIAVREAGMIRTTALERDVSSGMNRRRSRITYKVQSHCHMRHIVILMVRKRNVKISEMYVKGTELY